MKKLRIEVDTTDRSLANDLREGQIDSGSPTVIPIPGDATFSVDHLVKRYALEAPETIVAILGFGKDVAVGLVAAWLYDKFKGRAKTLKIEETEVRIEKREIEIVIKRKLEEKE